MKNWKIWMKMALGLGIILLLVVANGLFSISTLRGLDKQVTTLANEYIPLADMAASAQARLKDVPTFMNAYLLTGAPESWQATEAALNDSRKLIEELRRQVLDIPEIDNALADETDAQFLQFDQVLRVNHDVNEDFNTHRADMIRAGAQADEAAAQVKSRMQARFDQAVNLGDMREANAVMERIRGVDAVTALMGDIRVRMLRSLAEQKTDYSKDNVSERFPRLFEAIDRVDALVTVPEVKEQVRVLRENSQAFRDAQQAMLELWKQKDELTQTRSDERDETLDAMAAIASAAVLAQNGTVQDTTAATARTVNVTIVVSILIFLLGLAVGVLLTRAITRPVARTVRFAQDVAGGHLDERMNLHQKDEIGQLADALDSMVDALNEKIAEANHKSEVAAQKETEAVKAMNQAEIASNEAQAKTRAMLEAADKLEEVAGIVSSASTELSAQIEQSERGSAEQAARITETATAMEEMNSTVIEVAKNASQASDISSKTREQADNGAGIVQQAVASIRQVQQDSLALKTDMATLSENAQAITQIMGVISDIADQTNLLALNAAIEAARAGDAGRGFAVVADEVRNLAEKTMASTTDVGNAIKAIQESAAKSMAQVDKAVQSIEEATDFANRSGEALQHIVNMADTTADQVRAIATASEQQSASSEEISQSIVQVNTIAGETAQAMQEAARAVSDLAAQAQVLTGLINNMKRG